MNDLIQRQAGGITAVQGDAEVARAMAETQASFIMAQQNPRILEDVKAAILAECERDEFAEIALYSYRKGGAAVEGPSIRMAEALARNMGNISFGRRELGTNARETKVQVFCIDHQTNTKEVIEFTVPHSYMARGAMKTLTDPRDVYEHVANQSARRMRAAILAIIPGGLVDLAVRTVNRTLTSGAEKLGPEKVREVVEAFRTVEVTPGMLEVRLGHSVESMSPTECVNLRKIYRSIVDEASAVEDWFTVPREQGSQVKNAVQEAVDKKLAQAKQVRPEPEKAEMVDDAAEFGHEEQPEPEPKPKRKRKPRKKAVKKPEPTPEPEPQSEPEPEPQPEPEGHPVTQLFGDPSAAGQADPEAYWVEQIESCASEMSVDSTIAFMMEDADDEVLTDQQLANLLESANVRKRAL